MDRKHKRRKIKWHGLLKRCILYPNLIQFVFIHVSQSSWIESGILPKIQPFKNLSIQRHVWHEILRNHHGVIMNFLLLLRIIAYRFI